MNYTTPTLPRTALERDASPLDGRLVVALLAGALPVVLSILIGHGYGAVVDVAEPSAAVKNVLYGGSSLVVLAGIWWSLSTDERTAVASFDRPSGDELGWVAICFPLGSAGYLAGLGLAGLLGLDVGGYEYTLADPVTVAAVTFGAVLVAPLVEEVLFRGLLLGSLLGRGVPPVAAGAVTILAFGAIHLPLLGPGGALAIVCWSVFPTALRLRYNGLSGAYLLHLVNNVWSYLVVVFLGL